MSAAGDIMKTSQFSTNFGGNIINAGEWVTEAGTPAVSSGALTLTIASGAGNYHGIRSVGTFDLTSSYVQTELTSAGDQALASLEVYPILCDADANNSVFFVVNLNSVICYKKVATVVTNAASFAYSATSHRFFRFMENDGILYWQTAPDGVTWSTGYSEAVSTLFGVTSLDIVIISGVYAVEASGTVVTVDNVNMTKKGESPIFVKRLRPAIFTPGRAR